MNIFILNLDPSFAARDLCDKHVVKMVLETGQILSTVHHLYGNHDPVLYKPTHQNHPCVKWAARSQSNYRWLEWHFSALCLEYMCRYDKVHKTGERLSKAVRNPPKEMPELGLTPFALAMPDDYKRDDPVEAYRAYYKYGKAHLLEYKHTPRPEWLR